jgi:hypothetical protein
MTMKILVLGALAAALACGSARANVITYELTADATYTLGGVAHSGFIDIIGVGDTASVTRTPTTMPVGIYEENASPFTLSINLAGVGVFSVANGHVFDYEHVALAGFGTPGANFIYFRTPMLDTYDMVSALDPVPGLFSTAPGALATSAGQLVITSFSNGFFGARVAAAAPAAAAPEPATWAMMLLGFGGLGAALRAARRQFPAAA